MIRSSHAALAVLDRRFGFIDEAEWIERHLALVDGRR